MDTLIICVTDIQEFLHDTLLPALNMPGLGRHLFSVETVALEGMNMAFAKELYLDAVHVKIPLHKDTECLRIYSLDLELAPRGNY